MDTHIAGIVKRKGLQAVVMHECNFSSVERMRDMSLQPHGIGFRPSNAMVKNSLDGGMRVDDGCTGTDAELIGTGNCLYEENENTRSRKREMDLQFWLPPETEDQENDMEGSVVNYDDDDDDECDDGTKWGKPSSLSSFGVQGSGNYRYKEEKQKALDEVMNRKFRALVDHLLKSTGVASSDKDGDNWVDIVTSLSWEAASFVKPETGDGKAMDPDGYVKVKCVATGCQSESQLIKGMVFKKHAAHKYMPTKYKSPRLLLIQGALDLSLSGLSSFESMKQENDMLKTIIETIEMCQPNVILVEKTVSRDIQESILSKGMTLVIDMKLHRLQRVARCTGSSILSSDTLTGKKLRQCDSFHFEKFVEEHAASGENGKKPSKTLMFLEGCPTRLGCTILLKGTNSEELMKIKFCLDFFVYFLGFCTNSLYLFLKCYFLQRLLCNLCGGSPEAHIYYYAHHNKQLTIQVRRFSMEKRLPGETEGKLWMWSRCGNCNPQNGNVKSTNIICFPWFVVWKIFGAQLIKQLVIE